MAFALGSMNELRVGPVMNELHSAAATGSTRVIAELLSRGLIGINQGDPAGVTPLIVAASSGHTSAVRTLLQNGASVSSIETKGCNALHAASQQGRLDVFHLLVKAGSDLEATTFYGYTCLHLAATRGHAHVIKALVAAGAQMDRREQEGRTALYICAVEGYLEASTVLIQAGADLEVGNDKRCTALHACAHFGNEGIMKALIDAGANINSRMEDGRTPLHACCMGGHVGAVRVLLRAGANPLLTNRTTPVNTYVPLDTAVRHGRLEVVRELIGQLGLGGCAGASGGTEALRVAAQNNHVEIIYTLVEAGVEDTGTALLGAIAYGREAPVKVLLQLKERSGRSTKPYVNTNAVTGEQRMGTPLLLAIGFFRHQPLPRIVRMLIDAGADAALAVATRAHEPTGTPLEFVTRFIREKKMDGEEPTEEQLLKLEAIRRLLLTVESVHATSWLWRRDDPHLAHRAAKGKRKTSTPSTQLTMMLPVLRRRARKGGLAPETVFRFSRKL